MHNKDNIVPHEFKKGESGNPAGRPTGTRNLSTILREMLEEDIDVVIDGVKTKKQFKDAIIRKLLQKANGGDLRAIEHIMDRMEGKTTSHMDVTTKGERLNSVPQEIIIKDFSKK